MKTILHSFIIFFLILSLYSCSGCKSSDALSETDLDTIPAMIMQIRKCSRLYTTECQIHKIITHNGKKKFSASFLGHNMSIDLPMSKRMIAIPIDAVVKAYIDLSGFSESNIHRKGDKIEIVLPDPKLVMTSTKVDNEAIRQHVDITRANFTDKEITAFQQQGRDSIIHDIPNLNIIGTARENAAKILIPIVRQLGYEEKNITVTFRKKFTIAEITNMLTKTSDTEYVQE